MARNYPAGTPELFPLGANLALHKNSTLSWNLSAGRRISRQRDNFYVAYNFYVDPNLQASGEIISRQRENFYVAYNFYTDPNLHTIGEIST